MVNEHDSDAEVVVVASKSLQLTMKTTRRRVDQEPVPQQHSTRKALGLGPRLEPSWQYLYSQPRRRRRPRPRRRRPLSHRSYNAAEPLFPLLQSIPAY